MSLFLKYNDGEPCEHPYCLNHITHPCKGCGRIAGITKVKRKDKLHPDLCDSGKLIKRNYPEDYFG